MRGTASVVLTIAALLLAGSPPNLAAAEPTPSTTTALTDRTVPSADGVSIRYTVGGEGEPALVFIHGGFADRSFWIHPMEFFAKRQRVIALDLAGHGESGSNRKAWGMASFGEDVAAVIRQEKVRRAVVIGNSLGGTVALEVARLLPDVVVAVVGVDTLHDLTMQAPPGYWQARAKAFREDLPGTMKAMVKELFHPDVDPAVYAEAERKMLKGSPAMAGAVMESLADYDLAAAARATAAPIRCINGDLFPTQVEKSRSVHPDYDVVVLTHMGHYPMLENPALFNSTLEALLAKLASAPARQEERGPVFVNPIVKQRADPWVYLHSDGQYYFTATAPEYDRIELRRARTIQGLATAEAKVIWRKHATGVMGAHIWAPEIHWIDGRWFVYFAAGQAEKVWAIRLFVLENASPDPFEGEWIERGQLTTNRESFTLDATTFEHRGVRYLVWAQEDPQIPRSTNLYIARMDSPTSIAGSEVLLSKPEYPWEQKRFSVNEGPAVLKKNGRIFISYSASGTDANYCMGLLTADDQADLLDPKSWSKSPEPVFKTSEENGVFGPGHVSFTTTPDGLTDILVYHARSYREIQGDPLHDPNRHTRAQALGWNADGTPRFGAPLADAANVP